MPETLTFYRYYFIIIIISIIIIIIWHYNPLWVFAFSARSLQVLLSLATSFQFFTFGFLISVLFTVINF
jgi:hypothetical protein